jgi:hypothetical protein
MQTNLTKSEQNIGKKELLKLLGHAIKEAETPQPQSGRNLQRESKTLERTHSAATKLPSESSRYYIIDSLRPDQLFMYK